MAEKVPPQDAPSEKTIGKKRPSPTLENQFQRPSRDIARALSISESGFLTNIDPAIPSAVVGFKCIDKDTKSFLSKRESATLINPQNFEGLVIWEADFKDGLANGTGSILVGHYKKTKDEKKEATDEPQLDMVKSRGYEGEFKDGHLEGFGKITTVADFQYTGYFSHSNYHGPGQMRKAGTFQYSGEFQQGKPHGLGFFHDLDRNSKFAGPLTEGKPNGVGRYVLEPGKYMDACWKDGRPVGPVICHDPSATPKFRCELWNIAQGPSSSSSSSPKQPKIESGSSPNREQAATTTDPSTPSSAPSPPAASGNGLLSTPGGSTSKSASLIESVFASKWEGGEEFLKGYLAAMAERVDEAASLPQDQKDKIQRLNEVKLLEMGFPRNPITPSARQLFAEFFMSVEHNGDRSFQPPGCLGLMPFDIAGASGRYVPQAEMNEMVIRGKSSLDPDMFEIAFGTCPCEPCKVAKWRHEKMDAGEPVELSEIKYMTPEEQKLTVEFIQKFAQSKKEEEDKRQYLLTLLKKIRLEQEKERMRRERELLVTQIQTFMKLLQVTQTKQQQETDQATTLPEAMTEEQVRQQSELYTRVDRHGFEVQDVAADGHCLFLAFLDQLHQINHPRRDMSQQELRNLVVGVLSQDKTKRDNYLIGVAASLDIEVSELPADTWEQYLDGMLKRRWGDINVVQTLADLFNLSIVVFQTTASENPEKDGVMPIEPVDNSPEKERTKQTIYLGSLFNTHFVSLRTKKSHEQL